MLDQVHRWSQKWKIKFNIKKSNILHVRQPQTACTKFQFKLGMHVMSIVEQYKYLGIVIDEHVNYDVTVQILANAANRALGAVINKFKCINGLGYYTYSKLFHSCVCPIMDYASEVWGVKQFSQMDAIQNKAMRIYLGVHRFAPNAAISGDMCWTSSEYRRKLNIVRFWNRIVNMSDTRLPFIIYKWDSRCKGNSWSKNLRKILTDLETEDSLTSMLPVSIQYCKDKFHEMQCKTWEESVRQKPKLRTYITYKKAFIVEPYVLSFMNRKKRSYLAQYRSGILPLEVETGRWINKPVEERTCKICKDGSVEDENHVTFYCTAYVKLRQAFYEDISKNIYNIKDISIDEQISTFMLNEYVCKFANYITEIMEHRQTLLYN